MTAAAIQHRKPPKASLNDTPFLSSPIMSNMRHTATLLFCILFLAVACNKNHETPDSTVGSGTVTATVDSRPWASLTTVGGANVVSALGTNTLTAISADSSVIILATPSTVVIDKAYTCADGKLTATFKPSSSGNTAFVAAGSIGTGTIIFSEFNTRKAKGTFEFTGVYTDGSGTQTEKTVTAGEFNITR